MTDEKKNGEITEPADENKADIEGEGKEIETDKKVEAKEVIEKKEEIKEPEVQQKNETEKTGKTPCKRSCN